MISFGIYDAKIWIEAKKKKLSCLFIWGFFVWSGKVYKTSHGSSFSSICWSQTTKYIMQKCQLKSSVLICSLVYCLKRFKLWVLFEERFTLRLLCAACDRLYEDYHSKCMWGPAITYRILNLHKNGQCSEWRSKFNVSSSKSNDIDTSCRSIFLFSKWKTITISAHCASKLMINRLGITRLKGAHIRSITGCDFKEDEITLLWWNLFSLVSAKGWTIYCFCIIKVCMICNKNCMLIFALNINSCFVMTYQTPLTTN
jgi:hypothetical protein